MTVKTVIIDTKDFPHKVLVDTVVFRPPDVRKYINRELVLSMCTLPHNVW